MFYPMERRLPAQSSFHKEAALISHSKALLQCPLNKGYERWLVHSDSQKSLLLGSCWSSGFPGLSCPEAAALDRRGHREREQVGGRLGASPWRWFRPRVPSCHSHHPEQPGLFTMLTLFTGCCCPAAAWVGPWAAMPTS